MPLDPLRHLVSDDEVAAAGVPSRLHAGASGGQMHLTTDASIGELLVDGGVAALEWFGRHSADHATSPVDPDPVGGRYPAVPAMSACMSPLVPPRSHRSNASNLRQLPNDHTGPALSARSAVGANSMRSTCGTWEAREATYRLTSPAQRDTVHLRGRGQPGRWHDPRW